MKLAIICTTINEQRDEWIRSWKKHGDIYVAGDINSSKWRDVNFISYEEQEKRWPELSKLIGPNTYARKNFAYLAAMSDGHKWLFETDDDNLPTGEAIFPPAMGMTPINEKGWFNIPGLCFSYRTFRPRGWPLEKCWHESINFESMQEFTNIWQFAQENEPDVDAIERFAKRSHFVTKMHSPVSLSPGQHCPFNSQATLWNYRVASSMMLPSTCTNRVSDILRGYVAQRFHKIGYCNAGVIQVRNSHNLDVDFREEMDLYKYTSRIMQMIFEQDSLRGIWDSLDYQGITKKEQKTWKVWDSTLLELDISVPL